MNNINMKTLFVVSLLISACIPYVAAAGNNEGLRAYNNMHENRSIDLVRAMSHTGHEAGTIGVRPAIGNVSGVDARDREFFAGVTDQELRRAREIYRSKKTPENQQVLIDAAKNHTLQMLDLMIGRLELLQERIRIAEESNIMVPDGASDNIDRYILRLEGYKPEVESADTPADIRSVARSIRQEWMSIRREIMRYTKYIIVVRIDAYIDKANNISDRLDVKISELEDEGVNTTNLRQNLNGFNEKLDCVEENYELAKDAVSDDELDPAEVKQYIGNANRCIKEANHNLREIFRELRALEGYRNDAVVLNGTGTLEASGSGTARIAGSLDLSLACDYGTLMVCDREGDMNINVTGNGVKDQSGRLTMYHGFDGTADITGGDVVVTMTGSGVDLTVTGTGRAILVGDGTYQVSGHGGDVISSGDWQEPRDGYGVGIAAGVSEEDEPEDGSDSGTDDGGVES